MKRRFALLFVGMVSAASLAYAQDRTQQQHPSSDRARAGVGLGLQIHIPFGALNRNHPQRLTSVPANGGWTSCGLFVTPGMHVAIDVRDGRWASGRRAALAAGARSDSADANGYADSAGREPNAPVARANLGALVARVGNGPAFFVGQHYLGDPPGTGDLQLAINDDFDRRSDNRGVITATCIASHDTPAFVPPPREPPKQEAPSEPAPPIVTTTKPPPAPAPEPQAVAPPQAPIMAPLPETTVATTPPPEPPPSPPVQPATPWGWIIAAIVAGAALITLIARAAGAGAAAAAAITTRIVDNGIATQQLTFKPGKKK